MSENNEFNLLDEINTRKTAQTTTAAAQAQTAPGIPSQATTNLPAEVKLSMLEPQPSILTYEQLDQPQQTMAHEYAKSIDFIDRNSVRFYGYNEEKAMSDFLDELLDGIKAKDSDLAGQMLIALNRNIDDLKLQKFQDILEGKESGGFFGMFTSKAKELAKMIQFLVDRQKDVRTQFDKMQMQAENERNTLIEDNTKYQLLLDRTVDQIAVVMPIIVGGQLALERGLAEFNTLKQQAEDQPANTLLASQVQDFANSLEAFNHRLVNLQISFTKRAATTIPKIRAIQDAINIEMDNLVDKIIFVIPALKEAVIDIVTTARLRKLQLGRKDEEAMMKRVEELRNRTMKDAILEAKKSEGDYATKIALLISMKDTLVQICDEGKTIVEENRKKRVEAIESLKTVKQEMETALRNTDG
ncbi:toxic anion resistance protein [Desulfobacter latus]|uniref:Toxic anion resistance protein n=1 Tax=Desulfobacter latus TaxID=2292 RepID=A0A850SUN8_9BACT|nr:toxic anion resistance protein [Desulfobacter latus]